MPDGKTTHVALVVSAVAIFVAATMVAMWSFSHVRVAWGAYNLAIAMVAFAVFVVARARGRGI